MSHVLVVDDSRFIRTVIEGALGEAGYRVTTAEDGETALDVLLESDPDVVTMDVEMPGMSGIDAVDEIMRTNPTPILMLSAHTPRGANATLEALERGAIDFLKKPDSDDDRTIADLADEVVATVEELETVDVTALAVAYTSSSARSMNDISASQETVAAGAGGGAVTSAGSASVSMGGYVENPTLIIGASTGGPKVLDRIFSRLPRDLDAKVLVVQHMPAAFTQRFADRLDRASEYDVREATADDTVTAGEAVIAPGDAHLVVTSNVNGRLGVDLSDDPPRHGIRPAIDETMESAAQVVDDPLCGVVLTGMGRDGAAGIQAIDVAGGTTIAQDEPTSPVFGIPQAAIDTGCVDRVAPADGIVSHVLDSFHTEDDRP